MIPRIVPPELMPALRPAWLGLLAGAVAAALSGLSMLGALWCMVRLVGDLSATWVWAACVLWLLGAALGALAAWLAHAAEARFAARLRREIAGHLVRLPASTLARQDDAALRRLVSDDVTALHHMVAHLPGEVAAFAVVPLASIVLLLTLAGAGALWVLLPGALAALYYLTWMPRVSKRVGAQRLRLMDDIVSAVDDYARGIRVHRLYGAQAGALSAYRAAARRFTDGMVVWVGNVALPAALAVALMQAAASFAIAYVVAWQQGAPTLAAVLLFSLAIVTPALRLGHGLDYVAAGRAAAQRLAAVLREPALPAGDMGVPDGSLDVVLSDAGLALGGRRVLDGLSYRFAPGLLTSITGPSGAGKTTLLRALAGFEPVAAGRILVAGIDVMQLTQSARHQAVLLVPQGGDVLSATVRENLALCAPQAADAALHAALRQVQLEVDLDAYAPQLSGGERQRIGLARAFLSPAPIVLLDEPTSALDPAKAGHLLSALQALAHGQGKTVVFVTHDLELAARADACLELRCQSGAGESV